MNNKLYLTSVFFFLSLLLVAQKIEITHGPYMQAMTDDGVTIVWTTNKSAVSWVEIAPDGTDSFYALERKPFYDTKHGNRVIDSLHTVRVEGLQAGTTYRYRIFSKEVMGNQGHRIMYGNIASSEVYRNKPFSFTTLSIHKREINFKVVNDIHNRADMLSNMLRDVKPANTDFVIFNGDMVSTMTNEKVIFDGFMDSVVNIFAKEVPIFYARGNHETRGAFSVKFPDYFPTTTNNLYYTFRQGPVYFIVLDGGEDKPDTDIEYSELSQFDAYRTKQQAWLRDVVETPEYKEALYRVVIIHIPPLGSTWHGTQELERKFLNILNYSNVDIMLCGHNHQYSYIEPGSKLLFPILINDNETYLDVKVDKDEMKILVKDPKGTEVNKITIKK